MKKIEIPSPKFDLYELVVLFWDGEHKTQIVKRVYDLEDDCWLYELKGKKAFIQEV